MGVATFSPPIYATVTSSSLPCIVLALVEGDDDYFLVIDTDGKPTYLKGTEFTFDFRYDPATEIWSDPTTSTMDEDEE